MTLTFREQATFSKVRDALFGDDEAYRRFQNSLLANPRYGVVIPGTGGARKVRWSDPRRGKGKRGGIRVIYYYVAEYATLLLILAYDKNISDLTAHQREIVAEICRNFQEELRRSDTASYSA